MQAADKLLLLLLFSFCAGASSQQNNAEQMCLEILHTYPDACCGAVSIVFIIGLSSCCCNLRCVDVLASSQSCDQQCDLLNFISVYAFPLAAHPAGGVFASCKVLSRTSLRETRHAFVQGSEQHMYTMLLWHGTPSAGAHSKKQCTPFSAGDSVTCLSCRPAGSRSKGKTFSATFVSTALLTPTSSVNVKSEPTGSRVLSLPALLTAGATTLRTYTSTLACGLGGTSPCKLRHGKMA